MITNNKKRILFIAHEMSPYLELTDYAKILNELVVKSNDSNMEVRVIMPRFGVINERRHRLHEVVRLSGINVIIDNDDHPLLIKVASLPTARLQVYFMDNEDFFKRKFVFRDADDNWFDDNGMRTVFFCKGALETVKKFGWPPDIIHCSGWMTSLIPMYLKTAYKKEPVFANAKTIYTLQGNSFKEKMGSSFLKKVRISNQIKEKDLELYAPGTNGALNRGACSYADAVAIGDTKADKKLIESIRSESDTKLLPYNKNLEEDVEDYMEFYEKIGAAD
jgi:starch synthase